MSVLKGIRVNARRGLAAAGVVVLGTLCGGSAAAQSLPRTATPPRIKELRIDGNVHISDEELKAAIATEASHCRSVFLAPVCMLSRGNTIFKAVVLDRAEFERDLLRLRVLYWRRGWRSAQVAPTIQALPDGRVSIKLRVTEGPPTLIGTLALGRLDSLLTVHGIRPLVDVSIGEPLDLIRLDSIASRIAVHLDEEGFGDLIVTPVAIADTSSPRAAVSFTVKGLYQTRIESIRVEGTEKYDPRIVANTMGVKAGESYSRTRVIASQRALYDAGFFKRAFVSVNPGSRDSLKKLVASVEELPVKSFRVTGGMSTVDFLQADARYTDANFRNTAGRLTLQATVGNLLGTQLNGRFPFQNVLPTLELNSPQFLQPTFQLNAEVRRRWLSDFRNQTGLSLFGYRRSSPGVFIDQGGGAGASFTRSVTPTVPVSLQYRLEFTNVSAADTYYCVNFGVCDDASLSVVRRAQRLAPLSLSASSDRRDDPIGPTTGYTWRTDLEFANRWSGSQFSYARAEIEGARYFHASPKLTIAVHGRAGYVVGQRQRGDSVPIILPRKRFYAGGARSVRGYGENQLGPRVLVIPRSSFQPTVAGFDSLRADVTRNEGRLPCEPYTTTLPNCFTDPSGAPQFDNRASSDFTDGDFTPKPLGASALIEGSIEARYRFWGPLSLAAFIDAGSVGAKFGGTATVFTPGIGIRYLSPVGPIRVDLGFNPLSKELLSVVTELSQPRDSSWLRAIGVQRGLVDAPGDPALTRFSQSTGLFQIGTQRAFNPATGTGLGGFFNRLTLHLSIGEAF